MWKIESVTDKDQTVTVLFPDSVTEKKKLHAQKEGGENNTI